MNFKDRKIILPLLIFLFLGLIFPFSAHAGIAEQIGKFLISIVLKVVILASSLILMLGSWLLNWVTSPSFIGVKFTDNPFVTPAWTLVRDFVNMGFIMALIAIGVGTALKQGQYQIQKTLPWLIIIALAINFTPVICGLFIDISNIVMSFFLEGVNFDWAVRTVREMSIALANMVSAEGFFEVLGAGIGMIAFNIIAGLVFCTFAFLFAARYVALWIIVILSPLAFFCYILPPTRGIFKQWSSQLIAWCFIGAQGAFWIYLAYQMMTVTGQITGAPPPEPEFAGITAIVGYAIPVIFLSFGLTASVATSAQGADMAIKAFEWSKGQAISKGKALPGGLARAGVAIAQKTMPKEWKERAAESALKPIWGAGETGMKGRLKRTIATPWKAVVRERILPAFTVDAERKEIDELAGKLEKSSISETLAALRKAGASRAEQIAALNAIAKKDEGMEEAKKLGITVKEVQDILKKSIAAGTGHYKDIIKAAPSQARLINSSIPANEAKRGVIGKIKPNEVKKVRINELKNSQTVKAIVDYWGEAHMQEIQDSEVIDGIIEEINQQFQDSMALHQAGGDPEHIAAEKALNELIEKNRNIMRWRLTSIQAQASSKYAHDIIRRPVLGQPLANGTPFTNPQLKAIFRAAPANPLKPPDFPKPL